MCGINGFNWSSNELILTMNEAINYRGPDDSGVFLNNDISLGQNRLSILDLSDAGHQPMFYSKKTGAFSQKYNQQLLTNTADLGIVHNGEIYNFMEIKKELIEKGYVFSTKTDTEVILASYLEWEFECVKKFNGMWAFAIYDSKKKILFCSRDRLGVKPFYYYFKDKEFIFSSELKGILEIKKINRKENIRKDAVKYYFSLGYIPSPYTIYENIYKLEAGFNLIFDLNNRTFIKTKYYEIPFYKPIFSKNKLIEEGRKLLYDAVRLRLISDVPIGAFLSGGLDSSSVVATMGEYLNHKNLHTFSIGFEGKYDESKYVKIVRDYFNTKHHHFYFKQKHFEQLIDKYSYMYDEPFADYSGFPTYMVSKIAKKYVKVVLSGDGGDEIFGGYNTYLAGVRMDLLKRIPKVFRWCISKLKLKPKVSNISLDKPSLYLLKDACKVSLSAPEELYAKAFEGFLYKPRLYKQWTTNKLNYCLNKCNKIMGEALRIFDIQFNTLQDYFLVKVDRASMQNSLEIRSPFLDYRFIEFSQKVPTKWKFSNRKTKILMRKIIKGIVPEKILKRSKQGFEPPLDKWILNEKYEKDIRMGLKILKNLDPYLYNFYNQKIIERNGKIFYRIRLFLFINWWKHWIENSFS